MGKITERESLSLTPPQDSADSLDVKTSVPVQQAQVCALSRNPAHMDGGMKVIMGCVSSKIPQLSPCTADRQRQRDCRLAMHPSIGFRVNDH